MKAQPPLVCYRESLVRKDWDNPSLEEIAESLKKAHRVNRLLVDTVNELYDDKKNTKMDVEQLQKELGASRLKNTILTSLLSSALTSAVIGGALALFKVFVR